MTKEDSSNNKNLIQLIVLVLVAAVICLGFLSYRLQKELNGSRASYTSLKRSINSQLKNCVANAGSGYAFNEGGTTGAIPQEINLQDYQTQINACKAEYGQ